MTSSSSMPDPSATSDPEAALIAEGAPEDELIHGGRLGLTIGALMLTLLLAALDQTIVATALPRITSDLGGLNQLAWVVTAYLLASTATTPIWGKISDLYGRKPMLQAAIVIFLIGSVLAGMSQSMGWLIATRGLQGVGGGGLIVLVMAVIADIIPPRDRGKYSGMFGGVFGVASVAGPLLGGWFVEQLSWRWIFYINIPLGILALVILAAVLRVPPRHVNHKIDYVGTVLLIMGVSLALLVAEWGGSRYEWVSPQIIGMIAGAAAALVALVVVERRVAEPVVPLHLFSNKVFSVTSVIGFIVGFAMFGAIVFLPLFLQVVQGATPTQAGLQLIPMMVGMLAASVLSGLLITKTGKYKVFPIVGTGLAAVGMFLLSTMRVDTPYWQVAVYLFVLGVGIGNVIQVLVIAVQNAVNPKEVGAATSGSTFFRMVGGTFGATMFGAVMTAQLATQMAERIPPGAGAGFDASAITSSTDKIAALPPEVQTLVLEAFTASLDRVFLFAVPVLVVGFVLAFFLPEIHLRTGKAAPAASLPME